MDNITLFFITILTITIVDVSSKPYDPRFTCRSICTGDYDQCLTVVQSQMEFVLCWHHREVCTVKCNRSRPRRDIASKARNSLFVKELLVRRRRTSPWRSVLYDFIIVTTRVIYQNVSKFDQVIDITVRKFDTEIKFDWKIHSGGNGKRIDFYWCGRRIWIVNLSSLKLMHHSNVAAYE